LELDLAHLARDHQPLGAIARLQPAPVRSPSVHDAGIGGPFAVALAWAAALHAARTDGEISRMSACIGLGAFAFLWGHLELEQAISPSASSLLLIGYYAVSSVGFVGLGRARRSPHLRRLGLALGLIAAFLALRGAWQLPDAGTRIAAYLVVSVFLLGIAWWYRQPDEEAFPAQTLH